MNLTPPLCLDPFVLTFSPNCKLVLVGIDRGGDRGGELRIWDLSQLTD